LNKCGEAVGPPEDGQTDRPLGRWWPREDSALNQDCGLHRNIGQRGLIARDRLIDNKLCGPKGVLKRIKGQKLPPLA
jgi:hypothetical protein